MSRKIKNKKRLQKLALERIDILMNLAEEVHGRNRRRSRRYSELARRIAMRHSLPMPRRWKRRVCKGCGAFLKPGDNSIVRLHRGFLSILCLECNRRSRLPYKGR
ncbi:MAG: hypothetical protein GXO65_02745 [Euryarchaeota archaeon]|nr:hypothetical protein [Euryarchaeota archaeon]